MASIIDNLIDACIRSIALDAKQYSDLPACKYIKASGTCQFLPQSYFAINQLDLKSHERIEAGRGCLA